MDPLALSLSPGISVMDFPFLLHMHLLIPLPLATSSFPILLPLIYTKLFYLCSESLGLPLCWSSLQVAMTISGVLPPQALPIHTGWLGLHSSQMSELVLPPGNTAALTDSPV